MFKHNILSSNKNQKIVFNNGCLNLNSQGLLHLKNIELVFVKDSLNNTSLITISSSFNLILEVHYLLIYIKFFNHFKLELLF